MKEILINHFLNYEFFYIFLFLSFAFLVSILFIKKTALRIFLVVLFAILFSLSATELFLAVNMPIDFAESSPNTDFLKKPGKERKIRDVKFIDAFKNGFRFLNKKVDAKFNDKKYVKVFDVTYSVYENGFRTTKCNKDGKESYVFLGCSFVFGDVLSDEETLPYYFSKLMQFNNNVVNYARSGVGSNTALNILNCNIIDEKIKSSAKKHFFYYLIDDQIYRNFRLEGEGEPTDRYVFEKNKFVTLKYPFQKIVCLFKRSYIFRKVFMPVINRWNKPFYESYLIYTLKEMNEIINKKYNAELTVIAYGKFNENFINNLKNAKLDIIILPDYFCSEEKGYVIPYDWHPTAKSNEELAQILYEHINKNGGEYEK